MIQVKTYKCFKIYITFIDFKCVLLVFDNAVIDEILVLYINWKKNF